MNAALQDKEVHQESPVGTYSGFIALVVGLVLVALAVWLLVGAVRMAAGG